MSKLHNLEIVRSSDEYGHAVLEDRREQIVWFVPNAIDSHGSMDLVQSPEEIEGACQLGSGYTDLYKRAGVWLTIADEFTAPDPMSDQRKYQLEIEYLPELEEWSGLSDDRSPKVPVNLAIKGKAWIAAYLFAHGIRPTRIGKMNALDVSEQTVRQYVSDVKNGHR